MKLINGIFSDDAAAPCFYSEVMVGFQDLDVRKLNRKPIKNFLLIGSPGHAKVTIEAFFSEIGQEYLDNPPIRQYITVDIYIAARLFAEEHGVAGAAFYKKFGSIDTAIKHADTMDEMNAYLVSVLEQCIQWRRKLVRDREGLIVECATNYINENIGKENISLGSVASAMHVSPSYLSRIFKMKTGQTFICCLTAARVSKAKEFLRCTRKHIYKIAEEVGFYDQRYFCKIFKKYTGKTPREFAQTSRNT